MKNSAPLYTANDLRIATLRDIQMMQDIIWPYSHTEAFIWSIICVCRANVLLLVPIPKCVIGQEIMYSLLSALDATAWISCL